MTKDEIGLILRNLRLNAGKTQKEVAEAIGRKQQVIGHWETGYSQPDANTLFLLCEQYGTSVDEAFGFSKQAYECTPPEREHLRRLRTLDEHGLRVVGEVLNAEYDRMEALRAVKPAAALAPADEEEEEEPTPMMYIDFFSLPVSAGPGIEVIENEREMLEVPVNRMTQRANFALRVRGDSMEPKYSEGDIVLIRSQPDIDVGELGIFIVNGMGYFKTKGSGRLISLNRAYDDIVFGEFDEVYCKGKVLGKL